MLYSNLTTALNKQALKCCMQTTDQKLSLQQATLAFKEQLHHTELRLITTNPPI